jgi:hypothetical protein
MRFSLSLSLIITLLLTGVAFAEPETEVKSDDDAPQGVNSVNLNPIGFLFGAYSVNYERLIDGSHGFIGELSYSSSTSDNSSTSAFGFRAGYRWHWSQSQNSGFVGAMLAYENGTAEQTIEGSKYDVTLSAPSVSLNIGRRWAWTGGFNITLRFGVGRAFRTLSTSDKSEEAQEAITELNKLLDAIPVTLDSELSVGWIF